MTQSLFDIITVADACADMVVDLGDVLPQFGQVEQWVPDYMLEMGGSGCIFACQAAKLGLRVAILGRVGADPLGQLVRDRLAGAGVDTRYLWADPALKTGLTVHLGRAGGDRAMLTYGGALNAVYPADLDDAFLRSGRHLHLGAYYLQTNLLPAAPAVLRRAHALGLSVSLDTNWDPAERWEGGLDEALAHADLFFPNEREALAIAGAADLATAVETLGRRVPVLAVKLGREGALVRAGGRSVTVPVAPVEPLDTIGAGDSFDAGFLAGWLAGLPLDRCAALGNACGRANSLQRGGLAGQPTLADLPDYLPR